MSQSDWQFIGLVYVAYLLAQFGLLVDWLIALSSYAADRLQIKSYDYKYRRQAGIVNEILRKFVRGRAGAYGARPTAEVGSG